LIDLHTHTTASDGNCTPEELVSRARAAGVEVLSVTDHDTVAAADSAAAACASSGIEFVPGIEITSVADGVDVHVLGYFLQVDSPSLQTFLRAQRLRRIERVRAMVALLRQQGVELDPDTVLKRAVDDPRKAAGRPWIARALVEAGYVDTVPEAFDRWLARGRPAFMPSVGFPPRDVFKQIHDAGGLASLAHPGLVQRDEWLAGFAADGLDSLEAYHSEHDRDATAHYVAVAARLGLAISGGSDYHGDAIRGVRAPGHVSLPRDAFEVLRHKAKGA
jgi:predicted metal-dependent phosphoesterase TrpH